MKKTRKIYQTSTGFSPFEEWFEGLKDVVGRANIVVRLERADNGNFGDHRSVGAGIIELRIHHGPGYRLYLGAAWGRDNRSVARRHQGHAGARRGKSA